MQRLQPLRSKISSPTLLRTQKHQTIGAEYVGGANLTLSQPKEKGSKTGCVVYDSHHVIGSHIQSYHP